MRTYQYLEARSLAMHQLISEKIRKDPEGSGAFY